MGMEIPGLSEGVMLMLCLSHAFLRPACWYLYAWGEPPAGVLPIMTDLDKIESGEMESPFRTCAYCPTEWRPDAIEAQFSRKYFPDSANLPVEKLSWVCPECMRLLIRLGARCMNMIAQEGKAHSPYPAATRTSNKS
jgi:hypothetical protein